LGNAVANTAYLRIAPIAITSTANQPYASVRIAPVGVTVPTGTSAVVSSLHVVEPVISATGTVTVAATVYIQDAPTEGTNDYALFVDAGATRLDGTLTASGGGALTGTWSDLGSVSTIDINGGTVDAITSLTVANNVDVGNYKVTAKAFEASDLTSGRITFAGTNGLLADDGDLTFATDTLTATKIGAFEASGAINFASQAMTSVNIDSGAIDGVTLGTNAVVTQAVIDDIDLNGKVITMTGSASDTAVFTAGTNGTLSIVTTDAAGTDAAIQITADGTVDIDSAVGDVITLDSGAAIHLEPAANSVILLDGTISVDAGVVTGATSITSTDFVGNITGTVLTATQNSVTTMTGLVTTSALNSGSIATGFGAIDNGTSNITTGGIIKIDVDGSAENAAGSLTMGAGNDAGIFFDGTDLVAITNGSGASGIKLDAEDDTVEILGSGVLQATFNTAGLNLVTGDYYSINGASVLNATTLGSAVVTSSLTTVAALNAGSITSGFGNINIGSSTFTTSGAVTTGLLTIAGDIASDGTHDWDLTDNNEAALSFDSAGKGGILRIDTRNGQERVSMSGDLYLAGDLTVAGSDTTFSSTVIEIADPMIALATTNNAADAVDIGFYGLHDTSGSLDLYSGLFRDADDSGKWKLFKDSQVVPTTTVNVNGTGYAAATLVLGTLETTNIAAHNLTGKLTAGSTEIEGSSFDINGGTVDAITSLTIANNVDVGNYTIRASSFLADGLGAGRGVFAGTNGLLSSSSAFTFVTDTLTATKIGAFDHYVYLFLIFPLFLLNQNLKQPHYYLLNPNHVHHH